MGAILAHKAVEPQSETWKTDKEGPVKTVSLG